MRTGKDYLILALKGMAMGAADIVPGVSGGTIAFISGIYEELLDSINNVNLSTFKLLKSEGLAAAWKKINGNFLVALVAGIFTSILSLAKIITSLLESQPVLLWSFFFGLILASIWYIGKTVKKWNPVNLIALALGAALAFWITILKPSESADAFWFIFLAGSIAICAMILPGISGSFILLLMGVYGIVLSAIKDLDLTTIIVFGSGCVVGLISFAKILSYLFKTNKDLTIATLTGFLVGSLNKIWPWKSTISTRINSHGEEVAFMQENVWPKNYTFLTEVEKINLGLTLKDPQILFAVLLIGTGFALIFLLERLATPSHK